MKLPQKLACLCGFVLAASTAAAASPYDLTGDGKIDGRDTELLAMMLRPAGATGSLPSLPGDRSDLTKDGQLSHADWRNFVGYVATVGGFPDALFDVVTTPAGVDAADKANIAYYINAARFGGSYSLRHDFNADGALNLADWAMFVRQARQSYPRLLIDLDGNGAVNGRDLDLLAQMVDRRSYDLAYDFNADGVVDLLDWQAGLALVAQANRKAVFDVDGASGAAAPVITSADVSKVASNLSAMSTGWRSSVRFDFSGDGKVDAVDWTELIHYVAITYKKPDLVLDVSGDGVVNSTDLSFLTANLGVLPVQYQFDVNGDGKVDSRDREVLALRLATGRLELYPGDVNRDGCLNASDVAAIQAAQGARVGTASYDPDLDVDANGAIDWGDLAIANGPNFNRCR